MIYAILNFSSKSISPFLSYGTFVKWVSSKQFYTPSVFFILFIKVFTKFKTQIESIISKFTTMRQYLSILALFLFVPSIIKSQSVKDDFEGNGTITTWYGDDCEIDTKFDNPFKTGINLSNKVLKYMDKGGQYANARFDIDNNFDLSSNYTFTLKIYVPASGLTGSQKNQVSLKLQDGALAESYKSQCEVIKAIELNKWQTVTFDFKNDNYINFNPVSLPPSQRKDFSRVVLQVNGENNTSKVLAYIDDFNYDGMIAPSPIYDKLIWSDEFDYNGPVDDTKWFHQTQLPSGGSWYNNEIQHYTNRTANAIVANGILKIIAKKENYTNQGYTKQYTSARLNSKFAFKYGKVEVRAKLPTGVGTWPAIWMLGKNVNEDGAYWDNQGLGKKNWPACGEIDIMEHWGDNQNFVQSALHTPSSSGNTVNKGGQIISTASSEFHIYTFVWTPEKLVFSVDNVRHYAYNPAVKNESTWPFNDDQYFLLNIAIQSSIVPNFSQGSMDIDYVRVYQQSALATNEADNALNTVTYPNPVNDVVHIVLAQADNQNMDVTIFTPQGKLIRTGSYPVNNGLLTVDNLDSLPKGMYVVTFESKGILQRVKIIKH